MARTSTVAVAELDLARRQRRVHRTLGSEAHGAGDPEHLLGSEVVRPVDDALDDPGVVAEVDEGEVLAVLAPSRQPAADAHGSPGVAGPQDAAIVRAETGGRKGPLVATLMATS